MAFFGGFFGLQGKKGMTTRQASALFLEPSAARACVRDVCVGNSLVLAPVPQIPASSFQRCLMDTKACRWNYADSLQVPRTNAEEVQVAKNRAPIVFPTPPFPVGGIWRALNPSFRPEVPCIGLLPIDLEDQEFPLFLSTEDKNTTDPAPCSKTALRRQRPGRRLARGLSLIGPLVTTPWSSAGPCLSAGPLSNRWVPCAESR